MEGLSYDKPQTRKLVKMLDKAGLSHGSLLLGLAKADRNLYLSARNIPRSLIRSVSDFNAYEVMKQRRVLLTREALDALKNGLKAGKEG
ncbi:MAG: 50S ribosomal protein L4 [Planctomycetes bacterium]|nr:50S ribosomal protein L4 [Planctomycetota bacterium]